MHQLHAAIARSLAEKLRERRVVVWYDPRGEFVPFINELRGQTHGAPLTDSQIEQVEIEELDTALCCFGGSFFAVRAAVEPRVSVVRPDPTLIYLPGVDRDLRRSVLLELEFSGHSYEQPPRVKTYARNLLRGYYTAGIIDDMLAAERLSYQDAVALIANAESGESSNSVLKLVFPAARDNASFVVAWLADTASDEVLREKAGVHELYRLLDTRLGLALGVDTPFPEARGRTLRYVLVGEFRADLDGPPPLSVSMIPEPRTKEQIEFLRAVATGLRQAHPDVYVELADRVEAELTLATAGVQAEHLGNIDTFRFEEQALLVHCDTLVAQGQYTSALDLAITRRRNFWVEREPVRQAQWQVCQLVVELGRACDRVREEMERVGGRPVEWVNAYTRDDGWYRIDQLQRQLERWVAGMDDEPVVARSLGTVRTLYDRLSQQMAERFTNVLRSASWHVDGVRSQTQVYADFVQPRGQSPVAYFLVDALRFEMGRELLQQLAPLGEYSCSPAIAALPTITKVGMAALMPGAAAGFGVRDERERLIAQISDVDLPDLATRQKLLRSRIPQVVDLELGELLTLSPQKLGQHLKDAPLVVVRSQEIDALGESGSTLLARQVMDTIIGNVARAVRKLANVGIGQIVITADHGHLFALERGDDMKTESPAGQRVELHRRCWVGRGASLPGGTVRVSGADLGYTTDLEFVFPRGLGVFKAGGDLSYHHGGASLQELVVPVIQVRVPRKAAVEQPNARVIIQHPDTIQTRVVAVVLTLTGALFTEPTVVRPVLMAGSEEVGYAGMAIGGEFNRTTGQVKLTPGAAVNVGLLLSREDCKSVRIVVQHPATDAVLGQTAEIPVTLSL
jgi:hypothetical protein